MVIGKSTSKPLEMKLRGNIAAIRYPAYAEVKYDGELDWLHYIKRLGHPHLINKYGTIRTQSNVINKIVNELPNEVNHIILIGELYTGDGKLGALYDLLSNKDNDGLLTYTPFDILTYNGQDLTKEKLIDRKELMTNILPPHIWSVVKPKIVYSGQELHQFFHDIVSQGYEGIVAKNLDSKFTTGPIEWVKMKRKDRSNFTLVHLDPVLERGEVIVTSPTNPQGVNVGVKIANKYKSTLRTGTIITIEYQGMLPSGSLRHPVFVKKAF